MDFPTLRAVNAGGRNSRVPGKWYPTHTDRCTPATPLEDGE
ncbi:MAG: hypothetical protein Q4D62_09525 [Planctomycetia bacterium]|nr:hypothetical protein [Planctomycetia bacterium]